MTEDEVAKVAAIHVRDWAKTEAVDHEHLVRSVLGTAELLPAVGLSPKGFIERIAVELSADSDITLQKVGAALRTKKP